MFFLKNIVVIYLICFYLVANIPLNNTNTNEILSLADQKQKSSQLKHQSHTFQFRYYLCSLNNSKERRQIFLREEVLIEIMSKTLKHAGSSMFVTSLTTSAAFFTNMLTNISFVQVFGVFTGTCILFYFLITLTAIAAFAVS